MAANKDYWAARALQREAEAYARGAELSARLYDAYQTALRDLRRQINDFYMRYARENRLTYAEAVKALNQAEAREWRASLGEWVERINAETDQEIKARLKAELDALSYRSRMDRLEAMCGQMEMTLDELCARCMREMSEEFGEAYRESYYKKSFDIQQRAGRIWEVAGIDAGMVENVMSYPWSGANFSDRLWQNKAVLLFNLRQDLTQGLIRGTGIGPLSKSLSEQMGQSYKAAERVVRTELNHFHNEADRAAYQAAGIEWYEFMATLDSRTCAVCGALDGKHFKVAEAQTGVNYPPMHPNDRCTTVEYDPEEAEDWAAAGEKMPERMTYEEWYQRQVAEHGEGYVERERKRVYNIASDKEQYQRLKEKLGENAPATFEAFQNIKYSSGDDYAQFKAYARDIGNGGLTPLADFKLYQDTASQIDAELVGVITSDGTEIVAKSDHFVSRVIGSVEERRSGVEISSVREALTNPERRDSRRGKKGVSVRYFGKEAIVTVNPDTGTIIQANPRHSRKEMEQ